MFQRSVLDQLSENLSVPLRKISDIFNNLYGTQTQVLRITRIVRTKKTNILQNKSVLGDFQEQFESKVLSNVLIKYPFNDIEIFAKRNTISSDNAQLNINAIDVTDILPITMELQFYGTYTEDPIALKLDDIIIDHFLDENKTILPIYLQFVRLRGDYFGKDIIRKTAELSLYRRSLDKEMRPLVDKYLQNLSEFYKCKK